jgi:ribosomal protein S15P/S13E
MWNTYSKTKFGDQYQRWKKYRERSATEIAQEKQNAEQMYEWLENDDSLDKKDKRVQNLMRVMQNLAKHVKKHEKNPDYEVMRHLYKVLVEGGHKLKINPKHLSYNSLHYDLKKKVGDPRSNWHRHTYFAADMDDDPHTEDNTGILNEYNELVELDGVSAENDLQSFERTAHAMFPDPSIYAAFKVS